MKNVPAFRTGALNLLLFVACAEPDYSETTGGPSRGSGAASGSVGSGTPSAGGANGGAASGGRAGSGGKGGTSSSGGTSGGGSSGSSGGMSGGSDGGTSSGGSSSSGGNGSGGTSGDGSGSGGSGSTSGGSAGTSGSAGAGGSTTCAGFSDDFEDGNTSGWTDSGGDWTIEDDAGNAIYQGGNGNEESWAGPSCGDQAVEAKIKVEFSSSSDSYRAGIIARHAGSSSFYAFTLGGDGKLTLRRSTSMLTSSVTGTCAAVTAGIDGSEWFTLRMEVTGTPGSIHIKTFLNGTGVHDCTTTSASSAPASGPGGVMTYGTTSASFDDFSVGSP